MTMHLEGIHICHILKQWFEDRIVIHFQPRNEMKILVKMESAWSKKTPMLFGTNFTRRAQWDPHFVLVVVPQYKVARLTFVAGDHSTCAIFCFDIHA